MERLKKVEDKMVDNSLISFASGAVSGTILAYALLKNKRTINTRNFADYFINFFGYNKKFPLNSKAEINLATKVIAYEIPDTGKDSWGVNRMFNHLVKESGEDNRKLHKLNESTRYILQFPKLKGAVLENFFGYRRI